MPWDEGLVNSLVYDRPDPSEGRVVIVRARHQRSAHAGAAAGSARVRARPGRRRSLGDVRHDARTAARFGPDRVFDTPLSEEAMMGVSAGAAMNGMRPVFMHNRPDFVLLAFNQLVTHAAKFHFMDNGQTNVPMVVWAAIGRGWGSGAQHSQAIHGMLLGVPGLKIVMPSTPYDAKGLLLSAILDNNPVCVFEHRWLMKKDGIVPEGVYRVPIGKGILPASGARPDDRRRVSRHRARASGGRGARRGRHRSGSDRPAHGQAARRGDRARVVEEDRPPRRRGHGLDEGRLLRGDRLPGRREGLRRSQSTGGSHRPARCPDAGRATRSNSSTTPTRRALPRPRASLVRS